MTNEEKVEQYKREIEAVFQMETAIEILNRRDELKASDNVEYLEKFDMTTLGKFHKTYFVKLEIKEENTLNSFFMKWMFCNLEIAGIAVSEISWDSVKNYGTEELKKKLQEGFDNIIKEL